MPSDRMEKLSVGEAAEFARLARCIDGLKRRSNHLSQALYIQNHLPHQIKKYVASESEDPDREMNQLAIATATLSETFLRQMIEETNDVLEYVETLLGDRIATWCQDPEDIDVVSQMFKMLENIRKKTGSYGKLKEFLLYNSSGTMCVENRRGSVEVEYTRDAHVTSQKNSCQ